MNWLLRLIQFTLVILCFIVFTPLIKESAFAKDINIFDDTFNGTAGILLHNYNSNYSYRSDHNDVLLTSGGVTTNDSQFSMVIYNTTALADMSATVYIKNNVHIPNVLFRTNLSSIGSTFTYSQFQGYGCVLGSDGKLYLTVDSYGFGGNIASTNITPLTSGNHFLTGKSIGTSISCAVDGITYITKIDSTISSGSAGFLTEPDVVDSEFVITKITKDLDIPYFQQTSPPWGSQIYDGADHWSSGGKTIADWGCALTSDAMILKYWGINKLPDGTPVDPGSLNDWLKNNNGYDDGINNGYIVPNAISKLSKLAKNINNITSFDALEMHIDNGSDIAQLTTDIGNGIPGMIGVNGNSHYIVAKGVNSGTFDINDPYYANRVSLNEGYNNTFASLTRYVPSSTDLSYIFITATPNVQLSLKNSATDSAGQQFDLPALKGDPDGTPSGQSSKVLYLSKPQKGDYKLIISDSSTENYKLHLYFYDREGNTKVLKKGGVVGTNSPDTFDLSFDNQTVSNSTEQKIVTFDSMIGDINNALDLHQINPVFAHALISLVNEMKRDSGLGQKTTVISELDFAGKAITLSNGKAISNTAAQILLYDVNYLKSHVENPI